MSKTPGNRLKEARELMGLTRTQMCNEVGIDYLRLTNIESKKARMYVDDLTLIGTKWPELVDWIVFGTPLSASALSESKSKNIIFLAENLKSKTSVKD